MYELTLPDGQTKGFQTLADLLYGINRRPANPADSLLGKTDSMEVWTTGAKCYSVVARHPQLGIRMTSDDGHVEAILKHMIDEVMHYAQGELGAIKAPWQMTSEQWGAMNTINAVAYGVIPCLSDEHRSQSCTNREGKDCTPTDYVWSEFMARFGYGPHGPRYDGHQTNSRHEVHVAYALARGDQVPSEVLAEYEDLTAFKSMYDLNWFPLLVQKPYLRGRIGADRLGILVSLLKSDRERAPEISEENAPFLIGLMNSLPDDATHIDYDDLLYAKGVLHMRSHKAPPIVDLGVPFNEFAAELRRMQIEKRKSTQLKYIADQVAQRHMSLREKDFQLCLVQDIPNQESHNWANRVAAAIERKDLSALLGALDGTSSDTTKRAIEKFYPVKLRNVPAGERRRGVFALAGFATDVQYREASLAYEAEQRSLSEAKAVEEEQKRNESRVADTREVAARARFAVQGVAMNGAEFIEKVIREGYNRIEKRIRGAVPQYMLLNPVTDRFYKLQRKNGLLDYAQALLEKEVEAA